MKTGTNLNSDAMNMMLHCLRLGIVTGCYGLMLTNMLNDIMLGEPAIHEASIGLGVMDPKRCQYPDDGSSARPCSGR